MSEQSPEPGAPSGAEVRKRIEEMKKEVEQLKEELQAAPIDEKAKKTLEDWVLTLSKFHDSLHGYVEYQCSPREFSALYCHIAGSPRYCIGERFEQDEKAHVIMARLTKLIIENYVDIMRRLNEDLRNAMRSLLYAVRDLESIAGRVYQLEDRIREIEDRLDP